MRGPVFSVGYPLTDLRLIEAELACAAVVGEAGGALAAPHPARALAFRRGRGGRSGSGGGGGGRGRARARARFAALSVGIRPLLPWHAVRRRPSSLPTPALALALALAVAVTQIAGLALGHLTIHHTIAAVAIAIHHTLQLVRTALRVALLSA